MLLKECEKQDVQIITHCEVNFVSNLYKNIEEYNSLYKDNKSRFLIRGIQSSEKTFVRIINKSRHIGYGLPEL